MSPRRLFSALGMTALLTLAACGGGAGTSPGGATPVPTTAGSSTGADGGAACAPSTEAGTVAAGMAGFAFDPTQISGPVGSVIAWTNTDSAPHTATLEADASCTTKNLGKDETGAIVFTAAGTYRFFCKIHPDMKGTVTITG